MSTFKEIIARVDEIKPNVFSQKTKVSWLTSLNGKLAIDIFLMDIAEVRELPQGDAAIDREPLVGFPHEEIYEEYLIAKIDAANGEAREYQNRMQLYDSYYSNFVTWFKSTYDPVQGDPACHGLRPKLPTYYITAYGMAVMCGYQGTIQQWLASLQGEPGISPSIDVVEITGGHRVTMTSADGITTFDVMNGTGAVTSINGKDGVVKLTAADVGARADTWTPTAADVGARPDTWTPSAEDVKALPIRGGKMTGPINMDGQALSGIAAPVNDGDAVNWGSVKNIGSIQRISEVLTAAGWQASETAGFVQSITVDGLTDVKKCRVYPAIPGTLAEKLVLAEEMPKVKACSREGTTMTFEAWEESPTADIPIIVEVVV